MNKTLNDKLFEQMGYFAILFHRVQILGQSGRKGHFANRGQGKLLDVLLDNDGISQRDLVQMLDIRPSSVAELIDKLEQAGLVRREANSGDKRVVNIFITDEGREAAERLSGGRGDSLAEFFSVLSDEEKDQLSSIMDKLVDGLKDKAWGAIVT